MLSDGPVTLEQRLEVGRRHLPPPGQDLLGHAHVEAAREKSVLLHEVPQRLAVQPDAAHEEGIGLCLDDADVAGDSFEDPVDAG